MQKTATSDFVDGLPVMKTFYDALPSQNYIAIPDDWYVAVTDVVKSREAIARGQYRAVNMAGVAMITAIMNTLGHQKIPYIFGGDGAAVVFSSQDYEVIKDVLAKTRSWVKDTLDLDLRASLVPVSELRKNGSNIRIAGLYVSDAITNYAFIGKGIAASEALMKAGEYEVAFASKGQHPDLTGLSCRWMPVEEKGSKIISMIVEEAQGKVEVPVDVLKNLLDLIQAEDEQTHPAPPQRIKFKWPPEGINLEAQATGEGKFKLYMIALIAMVLNVTGWKLGRFDPTHYRNQLSYNTDYRKIQDGLRMTLLLNEERMNALKVFLKKEQKAGTLRYGLSEQDQAVLTCFVPSIETDDHYHFLDGAGGGYAAASLDLHEARPV